MMQEKQEQQIEIVAPSIDKVMCDGGTGDLGHSCFKSHVLR